MGVSAASYLMQKNFVPYEDDALNEMEKRSRTLLCFILLLFSDCINFYYL